MRTTLDLDDAVLEAARTAARQTRRSIGAVVSEWARRGFGAPASTAPPRKSRIPQFEVPPGTPPMDLELLRQLIDDDG